MTLLTQIHRSDERVTATGYSRRHTEKSIPLTRLDVFGLPVGENASIEVSFTLADLIPGSSDEYAAAFGYPAVSIQRHDVWVYRGTHYRVVLPALALLRALFLPSKAVASHIFQQQSLQDLCAYDVSSHTVDFFHDGSRFQEAVDDGVKDALSWVYAHPSARKMWSSVYVNSGEGRLGFSLPKAAVTAKFFGILAGSCLYVTRMHIDELTALEKPLEFAVGHPGGFKRASTAKVKKNRLDIQLCRAQDGTVELSDEEWLAVQSILQKGNRVGRTGSRRAIDALLHSVCFNESLTATLRKTGIPGSNMWATLDYWHRDGRLAELQSYLNTKRQGETGG